MVRLLSQTSAGEPKAKGRGKSETNAFFRKGRRDTMWIIKVRAGFVRGERGVYIHWECVLGNGRKDVQNESARTATLITRAKPASASLRCCTELDVKLDGGEDEDDCRGKVGDEEDLD